MCSIYDECAFDGEIEYTGRAFEPNDEPSVGPDRIRFSNDDNRARSFSVAAFVSSGRMSLKDTADDLLGLDRE